MKAIYFAGFACAALALAGCATAPAPQPAGRTAELAPSSPQQALTYHVFMGELAWQRGERQTAARQYAQAARLSSTPDLAGHAALLAYHLGDDALALQLTRRWLQLAPQDTDARQLDAVLNARLGNVDAAAGEFEALQREVPGYGLMLAGELLDKEAGAQSGLPVMQKLATAHPQSPDAHFALARLALRAGRADLAVSESQRAVALKPGWTQALVLQAQALIAAGRSQAAEQLLHARAQAAPNDTDLQLAYAGLLAQAGKGVAAGKQFNAVLKRHPRNPDALYALGLLALQANRLNEARSYFTRLLATGQRKNDAFYFLGGIAESAGQYVTASHWYVQVDGGHNWLPAQVAMARVLLRQHKPAEARTYMDNLVAADPDDALQFRLAEAQLFSDIGDSQAAFAVLSQALAEHPGNSDLLYSRALLYESLGQPAQAEADLRLILRRQPDNADALNALGYTLTLYSTRYQEARTYIERALRLKPGDPAIMDSMGWVEYHLGNYPAALGYLRKAYAQLADADVAAHLSQTLWAAGDKQEARAVWSAAIRHHPDNAALLKLRPQFAP